MGQVYSEAELNKIAQFISGQSSADKTVILSNKRILDDWDDELFIKEFYDDSYLAAVQQGYEPQTCTFEDYLRKSLATLAVRRTELKQELLSGQIDHQTYGNAKMVAELSEGAIQKHLEKSQTKQLIGV